MRHEVRDAKGKLLYILEYEQENKNSNRKILNKYEIILGEYDCNRNLTTDKTKNPNIELEGDQLISLAEIGRHYVYALIDPREPVTPFYIGEGKLNRLTAHADEADGVLQFNANAKGDQEVIGIAPDSIVGTELTNNNVNDGVNRKVNKILELRNGGYQDHQMARVIFRRVSKNAARAIESCLINSCYVYGNAENCLTNGNRGHGPNRFRPHDDWEYKAGFDESYSEQLKNFVSSDQNHEFGKWYVYVLRNPDTNKIFYVGKGKGNRLSQHFENAKKLKFRKYPNDRLQNICDLVDAGTSPKNIGRIVARVDDEAVAFMLETLWIKFIVGYADLDNLVAGHLAGLCRAKDDWAMRTGFDIRSIVEPGVRQSGLERLDGMLGENLDGKLNAVKNNLCDNGNPFNLEFRPPHLHANELAIEAIVDNNVTLRVHARSGATATIQVALVWKCIEQERWIIEHFRALEAYPLRREDNRFSSKTWEGQRNLARTVEVAANRARQLIQISRANSRLDLSNELLALFEGLPPMKIVESGQCKIRTECDDRVKPANYEIALIYLSEDAKKPKYNDEKKWGSQVTICVEGYAEPIVGRVDPWSGSYHDALRVCGNKLTEKNISLLVAGLSPHFIHSPDNPFYGSINNESVHMMKSWGVHAD